MSHQREFATTHQNECIQCESEAFESWSTEAEVSETLIKNVLLCGNKSRNGYDIPSTAFGTDDKVKRLYSERHVFLNHLSADEMKKQNPASRAVESLAGYVINPRFVNGRPYGDIETAGCPKGEVLRSLAEKRVRGVGLSHVARYKFTKPDRLCVESVEDVVSVDVVVRPATTNNFMEQTRLSENELADLKLKLSQTETQLANKTAELKTAEERIVSLTTENTSLKQSVERFEAEATQRQLVETVNAELDAAGIDRANKDICGTVFVESLLAQSDASKRKALIDDRVSLLALKSEQSGSGEKRVSGERGANSDTSKTVDPVAAALSGNLFN